LDGKRRRRRGGRTGSQYFVSYVQELCEVALAPEVEERRCDPEEVSRVGKPSRVETVFVHLARGGHALRHPRGELGRYKMLGKNKVGAVVSKEER